MAAMMDAISLPDPSDTFTIHLSKELLSLEATYVRFHMTVMTDSTTYFIFRYTSGTSSGPLKPAEATNVLFHMAAMMDAQMKP